jgi:pterin-4a-carbinolamine dehydratase
LNNEVFYQLDLNSFISKNVLAAGICNLTEKIDHHPGLELHYNHTPTKVDQIITELQTIDKDLKQTFNTKFQVTTIPPVSLAKFSAFYKSKFGLQNTSFTDDQLHIQQTILEEDVKYINNSICLLNQSNKLRTIRWDRDLLKTTTRKRGKYNTNVKKNAQICVQSPF